MVKKKIEQKVSRRNFLKKGVYGVLTASGLCLGLNYVHGLYEKPNLDFLKAYDLSNFEYPQFQIGEEFEDSNVPKDLANNIHQEVLHNKYLKSEWEKISSSVPVIVFKNQKVNFLFIPEKREYIADSFQDYVNHALKFTAKECGHNSLDLDFISRFLLLFFLVIVYML